MRAIRLLLGLSLLASATLVFGGWLQPNAPASDGASRFHLVHGIEGDDPLRILWFGNSHTYVWNVPRLVVELARASGQGPLEIEAVTEGGASLPMAMALPVGIDALKKSDWDVVLLQEGSYIASFQPEQQRRNVQEALRALAKGPRVILYQNWTYAGDRVPDRLKLFAAQAGQPDWVLESFEQAFETPAAARQAELDRQFAMLSRELGVETAFAGRAIWQGQELGLPLISEDGNHLDQLGAVVAAIVIYRQ
ncbi:MAG: hypothetical protein AAGC79_10555, partial [Pseudomonadota bacterium]